MHLTGLIPAAGTASRIGPIPCSKEIFPVGLGTFPDQKGSRPKGCCLYLLEKMRAAGAQKAFIIIREGKWDIPAYLGDGSGSGISLGYLMMNAPFGVPFTLDQAYAFVKNDLILFGFPDILFLPENAYSLLLRRQRETGADMVLGLFQTSEPGKVDTVHLTKESGIAGIEVKNPESKARYCWIIAVWTPVFTEHLHRFVTSELLIRQRSGTTGCLHPEIHIGAVFEHAMQAGLTATPVIFDSGRFLDIGTLENLLKAPFFSYSHTTG